MCSGAVSYLFIYLFILDNLYSPVSMRTGSNEKE